MAFPTELTSQFRDPSPIGSGGMGQVYRAVDAASGRAVAVKVLDLELSRDPEMHARFQDEVRMCGRVQHPNVVKMLGSGELSTGQLWLVQELVNGASLRKVMDTEKKLAAPKVVGLGRALLSGLAAIHEAGIVHRDLKPTNLLIDRSGALKIIDFGIARDTLARSQRTKEGTLLGTPHYLAPEQVESAPVSPATDVYAAGAILFEALAGRPPFEGTEYIAVLSARMQADAPALETLVPDVPRGLARVIAKMLARKPALRYPDGARALEALKTASDVRGEVIRQLAELHTTNPEFATIPSGPVKRPTRPTKPTERTIPEMPQAPRAPHAPELPEHVPPPLPKAEKPPTDPGMIAIAVSIVLMVAVIVVAVIHFR